MMQTEIHAYARQLMETFGPNAIAKAAERAVECEAQGKDRSGQNLAKRRRRAEEHARSAPKLSRDCGTC